MPIVTVIAAAILLGEPFTPGLVLGGAIVLIGVYVGVFARKPRREAAEAARESHG